MMRGHGEGYVNGALGPMTGRRDARKPPPGLKRWRPSSTEARYQRDGCSSQSVSIGVQIWL